MDLEEVFTQIAEDAIVKAENVKCSVEDFLEGLKQIEQAIRDRREMG